MTVPQSSPSALPFERGDIEQTIPARFEAVVRTWPERIALRGDGRSWSYARLNADVNRIARAILSMAPPGGGRVAYLVPHSPEMVVATLAALKAGKTYVALHPRLPRQAQADILRDVEPDLLLATMATEVEARALADGGCGVLVLDALDGNHQESDPPRTGTPRDASTLFYTSGSTGQPKGVVKSHRAVLHRVWLSTQHDRITIDDRQSLLTHCAFSASESDMFGPLLQGAAVCTFDIASHGLAEFRAWLEMEQITLLHPPALFFRRFLATLEGAGLFPHVRIVALAGDVVLPADLERWRRHFSDQGHVLHRFSITETALLSVARIAHHHETSPVVEAGQPVADKQLMLVDRSGQPVATGEIGELQVTSAYLSDGYWKRPEETAAAFSDVPGDHGLRTYRTGDMGRFEADGAFVFLGRRDYQVKIRGYRVDTREIESAILNVPGVSEVAVIPWRSDGEQRLRAFVVWQTRYADAGHTLRVQLRDALPEWKIPDEIVPIDVLPTTLAGKVDRRALSLRTDTPTAHLSVGSCRPSDRPVPADAMSPSLEDAVRVLFARILKQPSFPPGANFLEHGGNSLLMADLQLALHARFGVEVPLRELVRQPTVEATAALIARGDASKTVEEEEAGRLVLLRHGTMPPLFLVHGGSGLPPSSTPLLDALGDDAAVMGFRARGFDPHEVPFASIGEMAGAYLEAMRRRQPQGPYALGAICAGSLVAIEIARRLRAEGQSVGPLLFFDPPLPPRLRPPIDYLWRRLVLWALPGLNDVRPVAALVGRRFSRGTRTAEELRVWLAFRLASFSDQPAPFDGAIIVFGSRQRNRHFRAGRWPRLLSGSVEVHELGEDHRDVLDVLTPDGARAVREATLTLFAHRRSGFPATAAENSPRPHVGIP